MRAIKGYAAAFFIFAIVVLGIISILGVWDFFDGDVIWKSFETLGLLAIVALIIVAAGQAMDSKSDVIYEPNPVWTEVRKGTLGLLIASTAILALLGILSIWNVITNSDVLYKSMGSVAIIAFVSLIIVMTCKAMEGKLAIGASGQSTPPTPPMQ